MLAKRFLALFVLLLCCFRVGTAFSADADNREMRVGIVVYFDQPLFDQKAFARVEQELKREIDRHYNMTMVLVPVTAEYRKFIAHFDAEYEGYPMAVMQRNNIGYLIFSRITQEQRIQIFPFSRNGEQAALMELPFGPEIQRIFPEIVGGLYLQGINSRS